MTQAAFNSALHFALRWKDQQLRACKECLPATGAGVTGISLVGGYLWSLH